METLTEQQINELCMHMRVIDLMHNYQSLVDEHPEMKEAQALLGIQVGKIMELISDEQRDLVLERHKEQLVSVNKDIAKKLARREARREEKA